jgi:hypothetical protein
MKKWFLIFVIFMLVNMNPALAEDTIHSDQFQLGIGTKSCAFWLSSQETEEEGRIWMLGYWSGLNSGRWWDSGVGNNTDAYAIFAEVKKVCNESPSLGFNFAISKVYGRSNHVEENEQRQKICSNPLCVK